LVGPGALRAQRRVAHVAGVVIVEVGVAGNAEGAAGGGAELPPRREPDAAGHGGREGGGPAAVDLFAGRDGEREALEGAEIGGGVAGRAGARMVAKIV